MSESRALTPAEQQRARTDALIEAVEQRSDQLSILLEESGIPFKRFVEVFRRALIQSPDLLKADAASVVQSCINACTDGLLPDGRQGALVVRNVNVAQKGKPKQYMKRASWQPMVQGLLAIAYDSGNFTDIQARVVYEGDEYDYELGITPWVKHKPARRPARPEGTAGPKIVAAYAVAKTVNGGVFFEPFEGDDIRKVRAVSAATTGPWANWEEEMSRKGPLRRMWKYLPKNKRMERVVEHDDDNYDLDQLEIPAEAEPALKTGFAAPAALRQGADPVMPPVDMREPEGVEQELSGDQFMDAAWTPTEGEQQDRGADKSQTFPPRIQEYMDRLATSQTWLNIKQAIRSLLKAEDWDRAAWEQFVMSSAWARKTEAGDKTDFVTDALLFLAWLEGADPQPDGEAITGNLSVLEAQSDYKRTSEDIQEWVQRRVRERLSAE